MKKVLDWIVSFLKLFLPKQPADKVTTPVVSAPPPVLPSEPSKKVEEPAPRAEERYILRLTKTEAKNKYGLYLLRLSLAREKDLSEIDYIMVVSGQPDVQNFRQGVNSKAGSGEPIPEGYYVVGPLEWAGKAKEWVASFGAGLGPLWVSIDPAPGMVTGRSAIGFHVDWNESASPGSNGCIAFPRDLVFAKKFVSWFDDLRLAPKKLTVNYGLGSVETKAIPPANAGSNPASSNKVVKPKVEFIKSPNYASRNGAKIARIILHYTTSRNIDGSIAWFKTTKAQNPNAGTSAHYIVGRDGKIVQMVEDSQKAMHCYNNNTDSIGIEHVAQKGDKLTLEQEVATIQLIRWLLSEYHLTYSAVTAHRFCKDNEGYTDCPGNLWNSQLELAAWAKKNLS